MSNIEAIEAGRLPKPAIPEEVFARRVSDKTRPVEKATPCPRFSPRLQLGAAAAALVLWSVGMMAVGENAQLLAKLRGGTAPIGADRQVHCIARGASLDSGEKKDLAEVKADYYRRFSTPRLGGKGEFTMEVRFPAGHLCVSIGPDLACARWEDAPVTIDYRCGE